MKRNLRILGIAGTGALAFGALIGPAARAAAPEFHVTSTGMGLERVKGASNDHVLTLQGGNVKCVENGGVKGARFETTLPKTGTEATVSAAYGNAGKGCTAFGVAATVKMNSCDFRLAATAKSNPATATLAIECGSLPNYIEIVASSLPCTITIGAQNALHHVVFSNSGGFEPTDVTATIAIEAGFTGIIPHPGIKYTASGAGCPSPGTRTDGKYTGTVTLEAFEGVFEVGFHVF